MWRSAKALILARSESGETAQATAQAAVELLRRTDALVQIADALVVEATILEEVGNAAERDDTLREAASLYARKGNVVSERAARSALAERGPG